MNSFKKILLVGVVSLFSFPAIAANYVPDRENPTQWNNLKEFLSQKCSTDVGEFRAAINGNGYVPLIAFQDKRPEVIHKVIYNFDLDQIAVLSYLFDGPANAENTKPIKVCLDSLGGDPMGYGDGMKQFVVHQFINDNNKLQLEREAAKKNHLKEEHDPYQGDPNIL